VNAAADHVVAAVAGLCRRCGLPITPLRGGPVPLHRFFEETNLAHVTLPRLSRGAVAGYLRAEGVPADDLGDPDEKLAGFVFLAGRVGWAFVNADDILPRRRFSAAHELGHFVLHRETMGRFRADTDAMLQEAEGDASDGMEREANRFAVELLMPAELCRARADEMDREHGCRPRVVLAHRLAGELLVSGEAMRYRLKSLRLGDDCDGPDSPLLPHLRSHGRRRHAGIAAGPRGRRAGGGSAAG
jgi:hypothetical protein